MLSAEGFSVTHALTRGEAHQILAGSQFDLALVDISLPDGNGFAVCTEIKENGKSPNSIKNCTESSTKKYQKK